VAFKAKYPNTAITHRCYYVRHFQEGIPSHEIWETLSGRCDSLQGKTNAATTRQEENALKQQPEIRNQKTEKVRGEMKADIIESQRPNSKTLFLVMDLQ
jgi:hypothetical protein